MKTFVQKARKDPDCFDESHSKLADTAVFQLLKIPSELEVAPVKLLTLRLFTLHTFYNVSTVYTVYTVCTVYTAYIVYTAYTAITDYTVYTAHCVFLEKN